MAVYPKVLSVGSRRLTTWPARPVRFAREKHKAFMENVMTKAELVEKIHAKAGLPTKAKAEEALDAVVASLR